MARKAQGEIIRCRHFRWVLRRRGGVYIADGRANNPPLGRHSLSTKDRSEAYQQLEDLDRVMASNHGQAAPADVEQRPAPELSLADGWRHYQAHLDRPEIAGGVSAKTRQRYAPIFNKFCRYAKSQNIATWNDVTVRILQGYLHHLERRKYAQRSLYMEGNTLKQIMRWLADENLLPRTCLFKLPLRKVHGTPTYCYRDEEVAAMVDYCRSANGLVWLADVIIALTHTGIRISELAALRWTDIDFDRNVLSITNDQSRHSRNGTRRRTKNRRDRSIPMHAELRSVLERTKRTRDGLVFHGPRGGGIKPDTVRNVLVRQVIAPLNHRFPTAPGGIGFEHGRVHSFRHTFCSAAASQGIPEATVMKWLGHSSSEITRIYFHLNDAVAQEMMTKVSLVPHGDHEKDRADGSADLSAEQDQ